MIGKNFKNASLNLAVELPLFKWAPLPNRDEEKKHRIEDMRCSATRAAVEEGVVPGGGVALLQTAPVLDELQGKKETGDVATGISLVPKSIGRAFKSKSRITPA